MEKVTAILQARMGSSRLPGKVLKRALGRPLLWYGIERLKLCRSIGRIVLATTKDQSDDPVAALGRECGVVVVRGSEKDVLDRFRVAVEATGDEHYMRVTGDCPLIDPLVCDGLVLEYFARGVDYANTGQSFAEGLDCEVFSAEALKAAWTEAELPSEREHVTLYIRNHPESFNLFVMENERDDSWCRVTVDEPQDFELVKTVLEALYPRTGVNFSFEDVRRLFGENPELAAINAGIERNEGLKKSLREDAEMAAGTQERSRGE